MIGADTGSMTAIRCGTIATQTVVDEKTGYTPVTIRQRMDEDEAEAGNGRSNNRQLGRRSAQETLQPAQHGAQPAPMRTDVVQSCNDDEPTNTGDWRTPHSIVLRPRIDCCSRLNELGESGSAS